MLLSLEIFFIIFSDDESDDGEEIDDDVYDVDYHDLHQYPDILKKWIDKVLDIEDDPFIDFYGLNSSGKSFLNCNKTFL